MSSKTLLGIALVIIIGLGIYVYSNPTARTAGIPFLPTVATSTSPEQSNGTAKAPKPAAVPSGAGTRTYENGVYVTQVYLTNTGFVPNTLQLTAKEEVRFVNKTTLTMRIAADDKLSNKYYGGLNQPTSVGKNGTYQVALVEPGVFTYYNLNSNTSVGGQIFVK